MMESKQGRLTLWYSRLRGLLFGTTQAFDPENTLNEPEKQGGEFEETVSIPIEDFLDLHTFRPSDVRDLLDDYIDAACQKGFREVRIIHGKGSGVLRQRVQALLARHPLVASFHQADERRGGWGATIALLRCKAPE